ncbi:MAG TPA: polysaccharide biosynthesis C-terminal domain-containing protein [Mariprofundaceae bacterium]|nr:polysaccharide biosynthesis C-terminal domain-containing protein [Mariprofundaceae bacterium]
MSREKRAWLTAGSNGAAQGAQLLAGIYATYLLIRYLGAEGYGMVAVVTGICGWLSILNGGLGLSLKNFLIREHANRQGSELASRAYSSVFWLLLLIALGTGALGTALVYVLPVQKLLNVGASLDLHAVERLVVFVLLLVLLTIPFRLVQFVYGARQEEYRMFPFLLGGALSGLLFVMLFIHADLSIAAVGSAMMAGTLLGVLLATLVQAMSGSAVALHLVLDRDILIGLLPQGSSFFVIQMAMIAIYQSDIFIVNYFIDQQASAEYALHMRIAMLIQFACALFVTPFWGALGQARHQGDRAWFVARMRRLHAIALGVSLPLIALIAGFGSTLMSAWSGGTVAWNSELMATLIPYHLVIALAGIAATALSAMNIVAGPATIAVANAVLNLVLSIWLVQVMGVIGVALASLLSYLLTSAWYIPLRLRTEMRAWV